MNRREFVKSLGITGVSFLLSACNSSSGEQTSSNSGAPEKVVIGTQNLVNVEALALALDAFSTHMDGTQVQVETFSAGRDMVQALASGSIDFGVIGSLPVAIGLSSGVEYEVIYSTAILTNTEALVAKVDSGIKGVPDLVGKKVATTFTSTAHYSLMGALAANNIDPETVELIDMAPDALVAAFGRGDIDAAYTWDPARTQLVQDNGVVIVSSGDVGKMGYPTADFAVVRSEFAKNYPDYVVKYLKAILEAENMFNSDRTHAQELIAERFEMELADIEALMVDTYPTGQEQLGEEYLSGGFGKLLVDMSTFLVERGEVETALAAEEASGYVSDEYMRKALGE